jgi:hypothetical protein
MSERTKQANRTPDDQALVIDWRSDFPERLATIGMEIASSRHWLADHMRREAAVRRSSVPATALRRRS